MRDPAFDPPQDPYDAGPPVERDPSRATPSMAQYIEIKANNPDCLLFYRMGDFYELFFEDAIVASQALGIVLTKRGRHGGDDIPMCGVPVSRADDYLQRLIQGGHRVAVCEQLEDPAEARKRGSKAVVRRDVVRILTPGTLTEEGHLDPARANRLVAVARQRKGEREWEYALAEAELSTGHFAALRVGEADLAGELARLDPAELLVPDRLLDDPSLAAIWRGTRAARTRLPGEGFDPDRAAERLSAHFGVADATVFGPFARAELAVLGAIAAYLERTQRDSPARLRPPMRTETSAAMAIDASTRANLELTRTLSGARAGSLLAAIDRTRSPAGGRLLAEWLAAPLTDRAAILSRQAAVAAFREARALRAGLREAIRSAGDVARALTRLSFDRAGPRDLSAIAAGLAAAGEASARLGELPDAPERVRALAGMLAAPPPDLAADLVRLLDDDLPLQRRDGGFVRPGYDPELDALHALARDSRAVIAERQNHYAALTEAKSLRIKHNNVLGYFVEVPQAIGEKLLQPPHLATFVHRQTMAGAMRFSTAELAELEGRIAEAGDRARARELAHFDRQRATILAVEAPIRASAEALAELDVLLALAERAEEGDYVRPTLLEDATFAIEGGRHPVVEAALKLEGEPFIANDCRLSPEAAESNGRILLVTGANMAGKSTYLRQNALIAILAQIGAFVPARKAEIGIVDRLFSRVGAADDLARGRSTFMVEMVETAAILHQAGPRSLVILDEIGRGTATYDGLSIAWAAIEHLHETNRCRALFATHFHELTGLAARLPRLHPVTMKVAAHRGEVVFLHEVVPGSADRSYGIQVARLAGLPESVLRRAATILAELEKVDRSAPAAHRLDDLPLFRTGVPEPAAPARDPLREAFAALAPDEMSPREALEALYRLKALARDVSGSA